MHYTDFVGAYARRFGISHGVAKQLVDDLCDELIRQLLLGETVYLPKLGKFSVSVPKVQGRVSNLPGMEGKQAVTRIKKRLDFKAFRSAEVALSNKSFMSMLSGSGIIVTECSEKVRKEAAMAKKKKTERVTVDIPEGVTQITINVNSAKKKTGKGESKSKQRLLG